MRSRQLHHLLIGQEPSSADDDASSSAEVAMRDDPAMVQPRSSAIRRCPSAAVSVRVITTTHRKPITFRKTKREIQREREQQLARMKMADAAVGATQAHAQSSERCAHQQTCKREDRLGLQQLGAIATKVLASCKKALPGVVASTHRSRHTRRRRTSIGLARRCTPRRRLLF
ncbi:hypothetical protein PINS_up004244 [Pythium insidiosum]|nr:hypothetical protein PINS_up004244 [Pythium insidiosum]